MQNDISEPLSFQRSASYVLQATAEVIGSVYVDPTVPDLIQHGSPGL